MILTGHLYYARMSPRSNGLSQLIILTLSILFKMDLAVIILNWNAADDTLRCINQVKAWQRLCPTTWVVDNASEDGSAEIIAQACPDVQLIRNSVNLGYAGGNNQALVKALAQSDAPLLLLNNDAVIDEDNVMKLLEILSVQPQIGFVGPLLFDTRQKDHLLTAGGQNIILHLSSHINQADTAETVKIVDYVPGTVMLGRAEAYRRIGLLDAAYFFSGELPDLAERARRQGILSAVNTEVRAYHAVDRSSKFRSTLYTYYIVRNRFLFIRKFGGPRKPFFYSFWMLYSLALALKVRFAGQRQTAKSVWLGLLDGLSGRFGGQNERILAACEPRSHSALAPDGAGQRP